MRMADGMYTKVMYCGAKGPVGFAVCLPPKTSVAAVTTALPLSAMLSGCERGEDGVAGRGRSCQHSNRNSLSWTPQQQLADQPTVRALAGLKWPRTERVSVDT